MGELELLEDTVEEVFCGDDAIVLRELAALILDANITPVARRGDNFHRLKKISIQLIALIIETFAFGTNAFCKRHQVCDSLVAIILVEISKVR